MIYEPLMIILSHIDHLSLCCFSKHHGKQFLKLPKISQHDKNNEKNGEFFFEKGDIVQATTVYRSFSSTAVQVDLISSPARCLLEDIGRLLSIRALCDLYLQILPLGYSSSTIYDCLLCFLQKGIYQEEWMSNYALCEKVLLLELGVCEESVKDVFGQMTRFLKQYPHHQKKHMLFHSRYAFIEYIKQHFLKTS